ncbi:MAG: 7-carboxy-7-deazaguanine synthase QueE [Neisseriaceae bacterium]
MTFQIIYPINEIFATIQGEATFAGKPSIFIRMQGCNVGCGWCDTKHTWELGQTDKKQFFEIINKQQDQNSWAQATLDEIIIYINNNYPHIKHVVITGGEPAQYDLLPLCSAIENLGKKVQIETSGTEELKISEATWVTLSPKINMPGGKKIIGDNVLRANEIKMPIGKMADIEILQKFIDNYKIDEELKPIWLQPLSRNLTATKLCIEQALKHNWKLSIQIHKYLNIR